MCELSEEVNCCDDGKGCARILQRRDFARRVRGCCSRRGVVLSACMQLAAGSSGNATATFNLASHNSDQRNLASSIGFAASAIPAIGDPDLGQKVTSRPPFIQRRKRGGCSHARRRHVAKYGRCGPELAHEGG
ncbi:hypothetical protein L1887_54041 [Cichorium endivia]|nr:hypothetical protein L1887_54041 [Cichorium endivia]